MLKLNLGCGTNILPGWQNRDDEVDITKRLPWDNDAADFIFAEHVVEHITYEQAINFFRECRRVLRVGGVCRIAVPSVVRVMEHATREYCDFTCRWVEPTNTDGMSREAALQARKRDAMTNILFRHGHQTPWTEELLCATLFYAGFSLYEVYAPGESQRPELQNIEGHGKVIGDIFNNIETVVAEATKLGDHQCLT